MKPFTRQLALFGMPLVLLSAVMAGATVLAGPTSDARKLFSAKTDPAALPLESFGSYTNGCIAGAKKLSDGPHHQVVRLSRNRFWGHERTIEFIGKLADRAHKEGFNGLLVGDLSMPRGGPMASGHASHMIGLDVDIWLAPMPETPLTDLERETKGSPSVLKVDSAELNHNIWTDAHANMVRAAAQQDNVARVFATPAIKKNLCQKKDPNGTDSWWLARIRPCKAGVCSGHDEHIHARLKCAPGDTYCRNQPDPDPSEDGCGKELDGAMKEAANNPPNSSKAVINPARRPAFPLSSMPKQCIGVLNAKP